LSRFYQDMDRAGGLDYQLAKLPGFRSRTFRGPAIDLEQPYLACVGAAQTFGRFVETPFTAFLRDRLDIQVLNLGVGGAGPRHFDDPAYLDLINGAEAVVIQVLSGRSASNSQYDNSETGGPVGRLRADQSEIRAEDFFASLTGAEPSIIGKIVEETRTDYAASFIRLLKQIIVPRILFWFSTRKPDYEDDYSGLPFSLLRGMPQLINRRVLAEISAFADDYVECVSYQGMPQKLWHADESINGAILTDGVLENRYYPSPAMHAAAADALEAPCRRFLGKPPSQNEPSTAVRFVIVAAERTGTNLLIGLLNDYEGFFAGAELFNPVNISKDIVPWRDVDEAELPALLEQRRRDPVGFWNALCERGESRGHRAVGFKLLYGHGLAQKELLERLQSERAIRIIHVTRRNLLRRFVSERQALASGKWAQGMSSESATREPVEISLKDLTNSIATATEREQAFNQMFAEHPMLHVVYEDLARRPARVAERAALFLGLSNAHVEPSVKYRKTGAEDIADALVDFDALRAKVRRWSSYFDE